MTTKHLCIAAVAALLMGSVRPASAGEILIATDGNDQNVLSWTLANEGSGDLPVGRIYGGQERAALYMFKLPALAVGEAVTNATFKAYLAWSTTGFNVDLYALRVGATAAVDTPDFGVGPTPGNGTLIQDDFVAPSTSGGYVNTSGAGDAALLSYLTSNYAADKYLIVRLNADYSTTPSSDQNYAFGGAEWGGGVRAATLTLATGPKFSKGTVITLH